MRFLEFFVRSKPDEGIMPFSTIHILAIIILLALILFATSFKNKSGEAKLKFKKVLGWTMIITQTVIYTWFVWSGTFTIQESLPMYSCRVVILFFIYDIFVGNKYLKKVSIYWGLMGGILAMSVPDMYPYSFPHITNFHFFIFHYCILIGSIFYIVVDDVKLTKKDLIYVLKFTLIYNLGLLIFNFLLSIPYPIANYGFLINPPLVLESIVPFRGPIYIILVQLLYLIAVTVMHGVYLLIRRAFK